MTVLLILAHHYGQTHIVQHVHLMHYSTLLWIRKECDDNDDDDDDDDNDDDDDGKFVTHQIFK